MNIDIVSTGGTIGSAIENNKIILDKNFSAENLFYGENKHNFTVHKPFCIHSENLTPSYWKELYDTVKEIKNSDGIIILHGTDSLVYTAAFLSLAFAKFPVPIVLVSSNYDLANPKANGKQNFYGASIAIESGANGVFASYMNTDKNTVIHFANKLLQYSPYSDKLYSIDLPYGEIIDNKIRKTGVEFLQEGLENINFDGNKIVYIPSMPGTNFSYYLESPFKPDAYLVELYHSGTGCTEAEKKYSLSDFIAKCAENKIKVYLTPLAKRDLYYESSEGLVGAIPIYSDTPAIAYVKLLCSV